MAESTAIKGNAPNASMILLMVCIPLFLQVINASAVGVVLPDIGAELSIDSGQLGWLMTGFLLVSAVLIPFYGRLGDLYGARRFFLIGVGLFSIGSIMAAFAPNFTFMMVARIVQAAGGSAVPGLGMTMASRAYGPESRGTVIGILAATIGAGGAVGPLMGGALSEVFGWESIFVVTGAAALTIPMAMKVLPKVQERATGRLDILGGAALALMVGGLLLIPTEGARSGWASTMVFVGAGAAVIGFIGLAARQWKAQSPFIPTEFLRSARYIALVGMSFAIMAVNLAPLIGLPILLVTLHGLSPLEIGLVMLPGAALSSVSGVLAGRLTDWKGPRLPAWIGAPLMLVAVLGFSTYAGSSVWTMGAFAGVMGAGFGLVNTPLATSVSRIVRGQMLSSALGINSMMFFLGGSFGTAGFFAVITERGASSDSLFNPFHSGAGSGFSDGFAILTIPVVLAMLLLVALPKIAKTTSADKQDVVELATPKEWVANCSIPWSPLCTEDPSGLQLPGDRISGSVAS